MANPLEEIEQLYKKGTILHVKEFVMEGQQYHDFPVKFIKNYVNSALVELPACFPMYAELKGKTIISKKNFDTNVKKNQYYAFPKDSHSNSIGKLNPDNLFKKTTTRLEPVVTKELPRARHTIKKPVPSYSGFEVKDNKIKVYHATTTTTVKPTTTTTTRPEPTVKPKAGLVYTVRLQMEDLIIYFLTNRLALDYLLVSSKELSTTNHLRGYEVDLGYFKAEDLEKNALTIQDSLKTTVLDDTVRLMMVQSVNTKEIKRVLKLNSDQLKRILNNLSNFNPDFYYRYERLDGTVCYFESIQGLAANKRKSVKFIQAQLDKNVPKMLKGHWTLKDIQDKGNPVYDFEARN